VAWAGEHRWRLTDRTDVAIADDIDQVLELVGTPGDNLGAQRAEIGTVLVGPTRTLLFDAWIRGYGYVYGARSGRSAWVSFDVDFDSGPAQGPGVTAAITRALVAGLPLPTRVRCGHAWSAVATRGVLDARTAEILVARLADLDAAVSGPARL
jgi:hypothetical protein